MNATLASPRLTQSVAASSIKPLWAAVGVLSICVLAMGATLVNVNKRSEPLAQAAIPLSSAMAMSAPASLIAPTAPAGMITEERITEKPAAAVTKYAPAAPKVVTKPVAAPAARSPAPVVASGYPAAGSASSTPAPVVVAQAPAKPACTNCGTVEAVSAVTREGEGEGSGVGAVAGGVLGGVVGNQVGKGNGRTAATVLGAIGGGWAGHAVEKNMKKTTAYTVRVRMEDGTSRTIEQSSAPAVGSKVTLDGSTIRTAS